MSVVVRADRKGDHASLAPIGPFDLAHATAVRQEVEIAETRLNGCRSIDVDLALLERIDGAGAVSLARLLDRLEAAGCRASIVEAHNVEAARLIALYRERRSVHPAPQTRTINPLTRIGQLASQLPGKANEAFDFTGRCVVAAAESGEHEAPSIGIRCRGLFKRSVQMHCPSQAPPTCWWVSSSGFSESRNSGASVRSPVFLS